MGLFKIKGEFGSYLGNNLPYAKPLLKTLTLILTSIRRRPKDVLHPRHWTV